MTENPLLEVKALKVRFAAEDHLVQAVDGVDFRIEPGEPSRCWGSRAAANP